MNVLRRLAIVFGRGVVLLLLSPVLFILMLPFVYLFFVLCFLYVFQTIPAQMRWLSSLRRQGRLSGIPSNWTQSTTGTLIVDSPTIGSGTLHCWWTPEDVATESPYGIPSDVDRKEHREVSLEFLSMPFDRWCYRRYLCAETGTAILLATWRGDRYSQQLQRKFPQLVCVMSWSGPFEMDMWKSIGSF